MSSRLSMLRVVIVACACSACSWAVDAQEEAKQITNSGSNSVSSLEKVLSITIEQIRSNRVASVGDCVKLRDILNLLAQEKLSAVGPDKRQQIVRDILGADRYNIVETVLLSQMKSKNPNVQYIAIRTVGQVLFSESSRDPLKSIVAGRDPVAQFCALASLVALGTPGANDQLTKMLLSGSLTDPMAAEAIQVLLLSNRAALAESGQAILSANKGPSAVKNLLPALRQRKDFTQIVTALFRSDIGRVPDDEQLTFTQHVKLALEYDLLEEIEEDPAVYFQDGIVKQKVEECAKSRAHFRIYAAALTTLERSGEDVSYFEQMLKDKTLPERKADVLKRIINRIRHGQRLAVEPLSPTPKNGASKSKNEVPHGQVDGAKPLGNE